MPKDINDIKSRNARVEADKAWETSWSRRLLITLFTYLVIGIYLSILGVEKSWLHAIVPATGYLLSTLTLPLAKALWLARIYRKGKNNGI